MTLVTEDEAREYYRGAESGHDFDHVLRVCALAERLARAEGADLDVGKLRRRSRDGDHVPADSSRSAGS